MDPPCAKCKKTVYPTEKLNCLDKYWHKACFRCETCNMSLNMKNYKGYNKLPYCNAHYPTTKFTAVADTPENLRLKDQTKWQSQVRYKEDYEKNKGRAYTSVSDDPETMRIKKTQQQISDISYHGLKDTHGTDIHQPRSDVPRGAPYQRSDVPRGASYQPSDVPRGAPYQPSDVPRAAPYQPSDVPRGGPPELIPEPTPEPAAPISKSGKRYRAVYDYTAADDDEVSFMDGDEIVDVEQIDDGWMYGRVARTGQQGMLPANYVEAI